MHCLEFDGEKIPKYVDGGDQFCVGCQHCMAICPAGALSFGGKILLILILSAIAIVMIYFV